MRNDEWKAALPFIHHSAFILLHFFFILSILSILLNVHPVNFTVTYNKKVSRNFPSRLRLTSVKPLAASLCSRLSPSHARA
jgi:hypothetical protein